MANRQLYRILVAPQVVAELVVDRWFAPVLLRLRGLQFGEGCAFLGMPTIRLREGCKITLGNSVRLYSRFSSNTLGLAHPTILASVGTNSLVSIGERTSISGASIVAQQSVRIGSDVMIGAGASIWDSDFHPLTPEARRRHPTNGAKSAPIVIEDDVFVGANALILKGVTVGRGAVIGAGAVVTRNVNPREIVAGNPARVVGQVPSDSEIL